MKNKLLILLLLGIASFSVNANERTYKIELLVFAQRASNTEVFNQTRSRIAWPRNVVPLSAYKQVAAEHRTLSGSYAKMAGAKNYQPLMHTAWVQNARSNQLSAAVKIRNEQGTVNGFFRLKRGSLVHMIADIEYSPSGRSRVYRLNEKRRFKLNETHYLDHPKFGALIRVSPL